MYTSKHASCIELLTFLLGSRETPLRAFWESGQPSVLRVRAGVTGVGSFAVELQALLCSDVTWACSLSVERCGAASYQACRIATVKALLQKCGKSPGANA